MSKADKVLAVVVIVVCILCNLYVYAVFAHKYFQL